MKKQLLLIPAHGFAMVALIMMAAGCASSAYNKAGNAAVTSNKTTELISKGKPQLDAMLAALSSLINNPGADLKPQFNEFISATKQMESLADEVGRRASAIKSQGAAYLQQWDQEIAKIQNEDIRKRSAERKQSVTARFNAVNAGCDQVKADFTPFLSDIKDIRTALSADLTTGGVSAIKGMADKTKKDAAALRKSLSKLSEEFKELGVSLSASAPPAK